MSSDSESSSSSSDDEEVIKLLRGQLKSYRVCSAKAFLKIVKYFMVF